MSVCRHTSRVYCDPDDINGVLNVIHRRMTEEELSEHAFDFLAGAFSALAILVMQNHVEHQGIYMALLEESYRAKYGEAME